MSATAPLLRRRRVLAAAIEGSPGTAASLAAGNAQFNVFDSAMTPNLDFIQRPPQGAGFSPIPGVTGAQRGEVRFSHHLCGSGSAGAPDPLWAEIFLPACGMKEGTHVWTPESRPPLATGTSAKTITIGLYEDGRFKRLRGCMGTFRLVFPAGGPVAVEFTFQGIWDEPTDVALLAPTYPTTKPPRFRSAGFTLTPSGGVAQSPKIRELSFDIGNEVTVREDPGDASGYCSAVVAGRRITGRFDAEARKILDDNPWYRWTAGTEAALALTLGAGSADGNTILVAAPKLQITNLVAGERGGLELDECEFQLNRSASGGDDELSITFE
jgi:hypothetical protein